jgi:hypothetical protein
VGRRRVSDGAEVSCARCTMKRFTAPKGPLGIREEEIAGPVYAGVCVTEKEAIVT